MTLSALLLTAMMFGKISIAQEIESIRLKLVSKSPSTSLVLDLDKDYLIDAQKQYRLTGKYSQKGYSLILNQKRVRLNRQRLFDMLIPYQVDQQFLEWVEISPLGKIKKTKFEIIPSYKPMPIVSEPKIENSVPEFEPYLSKDIELRIGYLSYGQDLQSRLKQWQLGVSPELKYHFSKQYYLSSTILFEGPPFKGSNSYDRLFFLNINTLVNWKLNSKMTAAIGPEFGTSFGDDRIGYSKVFFLKLSLLYQALDWNFQASYAPAVYFNKSFNPITNRRWGLSAAYRQALLSFQLIDLYDHLRDVRASGWSTSLGYQYLF